MGKILDKFKAYAKWGSKDFTKDFKVLCSINNGTDGIQKHLGEIRNKTGVAVDELEQEQVNLADKIQSLSDSYLNRVVAVISDKGVYGVEGKDVINRGYGYFEGDGISAIKDEEGFYIGESFENIKTTTAYFDTLEEITPSEWNLTRESAGDNISTIAVSQILWEAGNTYTISGKAHKKVVGTYLASSTNYEKLNEEYKDDGRFTVTFIVNTSTTHWFHYKTDDIMSTGDTFKLFDLSITKNSNKVPFVPTSFKGGKFKLEENYSMVGRTAIIRFGADETTSGYALDNIQGRFHSDSFGTNIGKEKICVVSGTTIETRHIGGTTQTREVYGNGFNSYDIGKVSTNKLNDIKKMKYFILLDKVLTSEEVDQTIEILESGNYTLPPQFQGTTMPMNDMVRRNDENGLVDDIIKANTTRDLWYASDIAVYDVTDATTGENSKVIVKEDGTITGTAMEDVSGQLRVTSESFVRKVK